jgi:hypothetical protein
METTQDAPRRAPLGAAELERLITPPAVTMLVLAGLWTLFLLTALVSDPVVRMFWVFGIEFDRSEGIRAVANGIGLLFELAIAVTVLLGSAQLLRRRSWAMGVTAAVLMAIPCFGPCCPIGIPVGAWALFVLLRPEVREALERPV